jgi:peptidoglycan/xylan/chitin deacetylase (PgdA/CDA1 family)
VPEKALMPPTQINQRTWKRFVLRACGTLIPEFYRPPAGILLPSGHIAGDVIPDHVRYLFRIPTVTKFKDDIEYLVRHYEPLPLFELERVGSSSQERIPAKHFVLSMDDGMREVYDFIAPFLREKGIPAIFFLNSSTIDNKQLMWRHKISLLIARAQLRQEGVFSLLSRYPGKTLRAKLLSLRFADRHILDEIAAFLEVDFREYLRRAQPYLTTEQILELSRQGFEFGAHSASHPCFNEIPVEDQQEQICESVHFIRALGLTCRYFAFPFHDNGVPISIFRYMRKLGVVMSFGTSDARVDSVPFSFQRFALDAENSDSTVPELLEQLSAKSLAFHLSRTVVIRRN